MSEQALNPAASANGSATAAATTVTFSALSLPGKPAADAGKILPTVAVEKPDMESLVKELNTVSRNVGRDLRFQVDLEKGRAVLQVLDRETGELIRQIPQDMADVALKPNGTLSVRLIDAKI